MDFNRRTVLRTLSGWLAQKTAPVAPIAHACVYAESPFWVQAAASYLEPTPNPCSMLVPLQMCDCGAIRVNPATAAKLAGRADMKGDK